MSYTISELRNNIFSKVFETYDIIKEYFGEEFTDLQGVPSKEAVKDLLNYSNIQAKDETYELSTYEFNRLKERYNTSDFYIYVWWPHVVVSNENNKSIGIDDLYAKIKIDIKGLIPYVSRGFKLIRSTFSYNQYVSGYMHSHTPKFYETPEFEDPCLGTGPIKNTILSLHNEWDEVTWMLFCRELSLYVTVESLAGGPYFRLEEVGVSGSMSKVNIDSYKICSNFESISGYHDISIWLKDFILYYLRNSHLSFGYKNNSFVLSLPVFDFIIDISNCFIDWFNKELPFNKEILFSDRILLKMLVMNNNFYEERLYNRTPSLSHRNALLFTFKGKEIRLDIKDQDAEDKKEETLILNPEISYTILNFILKIINYKYINEYYNKYNDSSNTAESSSTSENVLYI